MSLPAGIEVWVRGWLSSNGVAFTSGTRALVDTGYHSHSAQTVLLAQHCFGPAGPDLLVNTHLHSDHCGGNAALLRRWPGLPLLIPSGEWDAVSLWDEDVLTYRATGQNCERFSATGRLVAGAEPVRLGERWWEIHAAPGHDPHAVLLFEPIDRILISGDALWERGFGIVFPELEGISAFSQVAETLELIERLNPSWVIPGHGDPFRDVAAALEFARTRLKAQVASPDRHARHAAKVLIKFFLMEYRETTVDALMAWLQTSSYFSTIHRHHFANIQFRAWSEELLSELVRNGAVVQDAARLMDGI